MSGRTFGAGRLGCSLAIALGIFGHGAAAATINVPADQPTLQNAVTAAQGGDEIVLANGVYFGAGFVNINTQGKAITIRSAEGPSTCIIDAGFAGRHFIFETIEGPDTVIRGITLRKGFPGADFEHGASVRITHASPTFEECVFEKSYESALSTVAVFSLSNPTFLRCKFTVGDDGPSHLRLLAANAVLRECELTKETGTTTSSSITLGGNSLILIDRCRIWGHDSGDYAAVLVTQSKVHCRDSIFWGNHGGDGLFSVTNAGAGGLVVERCTIVDNDGGPAFRLTNVTNALFRSCVIWGNGMNGVGKSLLADQILLEATGSTYSAPHCCIQGWSAPFAGAGTNGLAPRFVNQAGVDGVVGTADDDLHLAPDSPFLDRGDPTFMDAGAVDAAGAPRLVGCRLDVGALESAGVRDCDANGTGDACEILAGASDCDGNGVVDECEPGCASTPFCASARPTVTVASPVYTPFLANATATFAPDGLPPAHGPVRVDITARSNLDDPGHDINVLIGGTLIGRAFEYTGVDCPSVTQTESLWCDEATFNASLSDGSVSITLAALGVTGSCTSSLASVAITYTGLVPIHDCDGDGVPDECEVDCDDDGTPDDCQITTSSDCNANGIPDACDLATGALADLDSNGIPDLCESDCNGNGVPDVQDVADGAETDCDGDGVLDACEKTSSDCDRDGIDDECAISHQLVPDCNGNGLPDSCDVASGAPDLNANGVPDACEPDCDQDGLPDFVEILLHFETDLNLNSVPDGCEGLGDIDGDGVVGGADLSAILGAFGVCPERGACPADLDGDGVVSGADIAIVLGRWGA